MGTYVRQEKIIGVGPWVWLWNENGAWDGPAKEFEPLRDKIQALTPGRKLVLSAGGCMGMYPRLWAETFENVVTAEPCPVNYEILAQNCQLPKIRRMQAALGERSGTVTLHRYNNTNVGMHSLVRVGQGGEDVIVPMVRIDDLQLEALDVLQLDVEGYEEKVVQGGLETISRFRPVIAVESVSQAMRGYMSQLGYEEAGYSSSDRIFAFRG